MPHARSACETLDDFVELHYPQLQILGVPQKYWPTLFNKLKNEVSPRPLTFVEQRNYSIDSSKSLLVLPTPSLSQTASRQ